MKLHKGAFVSVLLLMAQDIFSDQSLQGFMTFTEHWEGRRTEAYWDADGWSIGVGHYMGKVLRVRALSHKDIDALLKIDIMKAIGIARRNVKNFDNLPHEVKLIVVDLAFNLGEKRFKTFKKTIAACERGDFITMSYELKDSNWYYQVGRRSKHHVAKLVEIARLIA